MKTLRPCPNMQQATWDDSVIELLPNTDLGRSMDELLGPDSDHSVEVLPQEHSETGATLDQSTPRRRHPSQQRGGRGARRVTFGDTASDRNSESEQSYDKHPAHAGYSADRSETFIEEADLSDDPPPATCGTKTSASPVTSVYKLCSSVDQLCDWSPSSPGPGDNASRDQEAST